MESLHLPTFTDSLMHAAGIIRPWRAQQIRFDQNTKTIHLWITRHPAQNTEKKRRNWLGISVAAITPEAPPAAAEMQWRHLNCMDYICQIHTVDQLDERHHDLPWFGQANLPFSNRFSRQIFTCLTDGMEMEAICSLLNVSFPDLWKFKYALDNGKVVFEYTPTKKIATDTSIKSKANDAVFPISSTVPDVTDPLWDLIITGQSNLHIKTLSFQLMLTKLRQQVNMQKNDEVKIMKLRELHRYVERNERSLGYELNQLRGLSQSKHV